MITLENVVPFPKGAYTNETLLRKVCVLSHTGIDAPYGHCTDGLMELAGAKNIRHVCNGGIQVTKELRNKKDIQDRIRFTLEAAYQGIVSYF